MHQRIEIVGQSAQGPIEMWVVTKESWQTQNSPCAVSYFIKTGLVSIRGSDRKYHAINVLGEEDVVHLRDALIALCKFRKIG